jgi:UDP-N-acetylmuramyl pentapeptide synthase
VNAVPSRITAKTSKKEKIMVLPHMTEAAAAAAEEEDNEVQRSADSEKVEVLIALSDYRRHNPWWLAIHGAQIADSQTVIASAGVDSK